MITMENYRNLRFASGLCFSFIAILNIINMSSHKLEVWDLLLLTGIILLAVSLFVAKPILSTIGSTVCIICEIHRIIFWIKILMDMHWFSVRIVASLLLPLLFYIFLFIASLSPHITKPFGLAAGGAAVIRFLLLISDSSDFKAITIFLYVIPIIAAILLALSCPAKTNRKDTIKTVTPMPASSVESQTDRLLKLKSLLDNNVITQEEFDSKKNQILGS